MSDGVNVTYHRHTVERLEGERDRLVAEIRAQREVIRVAFDTIHAGRFYDAEQLLLTALAAPDDRAPRD